MPSISPKVERDLVDAYFHRHIYNTAIIPFFLAAIGLFLWWLTGLSSLIWWTVFAEALMVIVLGGCCIWYNNQDGEVSLWQWELIVGLVCVPLCGTLGSLVWLIDDAVSPPLVVAAIAFFLPGPAVAVQFLSLIPRAWLAATVSLFSPMVLHAFTQWEFAPTFGIAFGFWMIAHAGYMYWLVTKHYSDHHNIFQLNDELAVQSQLAEDANVEKSRFIARASHDLRQPLASASLLLESAMQQQDTVKRLDTLKRCLKMCRDTGDTIDTLLNIGRLDTKSQQALNPQFKLDEVFNKLNALYLPQCEEKGISIQFVPSNIQIDADLLAMERLLGNLIANAVSATDQGGINVLSHRTDQGATIEIHDTGVGLTAKQLHGLFSKCQTDSPQAHKSPATTNRYGLGSEIVSRLAQTMGISIRASSELDKGTVIYLNLPPHVVGNPSLSQDNLHGIKTIVAAGKDQLPAWFVPALIRWGMQVELAPNVFHHQQNSGSETLDDFDLIITQAKLFSSSKNTPTLILVNAGEELNNTKLTAKCAVLELPITGAALRLEIESLLMDN